MRTLAAFLFLAPLLSGQSSGDLDFLSGQTDGRALRQMLHESLRAKALRMLDARKQETSRISSSQQVFERRRLVRDRMTRALGGFPERTPLNARVTGTPREGDL